MSLATLFKCDIETRTFPDFSTDAFSICIIKRVNLGHPIELFHCAVCELKLF